MRGHSKSECNLSIKRERFEQFAKYGLLTHTAEGKETAPFGYNPTVPNAEKESTVDVLQAVLNTFDVREIYNMF